MNTIQHPFIMMVAAPRNKGKTYLNEHLIDNDDFIGNYDYVYIMSPTLKFKSYYKKILKKNKKLREKTTLLKNVNTDLITELIDKQEQCAEKVEAHNEKVDLLLEQYEASPFKSARKPQHVITYKHEGVTETPYDLNYLRCPMALLILDDIIDSNVTNFKGIVDVIAERGRHFNMSAIINSQRISAVSRSIRLNSDYTFMFSQNTAEEMEQFIDKYISKNEKREMRAKIYKALSRPYQFIYIDNGEFDMLKKLKTSNADDFIKRNHYEIIPSSMSKYYEEVVADMNEKKSAKKKKKDLAELNKKKKMEAKG